MPSANRITSNEEVGRIMKAFAEEGLGAKAFPKEKRMSSAAASAPHH
jgi:hypothetical protein